MRQRVFQILVAGIVVTSALPALWAPAAADLTWTSPVNVSDPGVFPLAPKLSGDHTGAVVAWITNEGPNSTLQAATFDGTTWSAPLNVDGPGPLAGVEVTGNDSGAVAAWGTDDGLNGLVRVATFNGASWSTPITLGAGTEAKLTGGLNDTVVVWSVNDTNEIHAATFDGSTWSPPVTISVPAPPFPFAPAVSGSAAGAVAVWKTIASVEAATFDGSSWAPPVTLSTGGDCPFALNVLGNNIAAIAIWASTGSSCLGLPADGVVQAATFDGTWAPPETISPASAFNEAVIEIAGTPGNAVAVWPNVNVVEAVTYIGGAWSAPTPLSVTPAGMPSVDGSGSSATAVWMEDGVIYAASLDATTWSTPVRLSFASVSSYPDVVDPDGALAVWHGFEGTQAFVQAAIGSPAGPVPVVATPRTTG